MRIGIATVSLASQEVFLGPSGFNMIPSSPKIPLRNYFLDLVADSDRKESSVYLRGADKLIQEIWNEMVPNNWRRLKLDIAKILKIHPMSFYSYKNGKKAISVQMTYGLLVLWKTYCQKSDKDIQEKWDRIYKNDLSFSARKVPVPTKLPRCLCPKLSYLIGFLCGDGHLTDREDQYLIKLSDKSIDHLRYLRFLFANIFNVEMPLYQISKGGYALQAGNKVIYRFLTQVLKIRVGKIPDIVREFDPTNNKYFLVGVFDSGGHVDSSYLNSRITISQSKYEFLEKVRTLFEDLDISFTGPHLHKTKLGSWYTIQIRKKSEVLKYIKEIGSYHVDKLEKIKSLKKEIYAHRHCHATA